jgi:hypothetical protein
MKRAAKFLGLTILACGWWTAVARADVLAEYTFDPGANFNPQTQGWTLGDGTEEDMNFFNSGNVSLLLIESTGPPNGMFTDTVPTNVFFDRWSFTGHNRFAGNSQEEFGMFMFVDDGTNIWHLSFYNHGNDTTDGIYNGGDPNGPVLANTATKIFEEPVDPNFSAGTAKNKPFDGFHDYAIVDPDGTGGSAPHFYLDGADVTPVVTLLSEPSKFPAGTVGWGSLNPNESGFFQTTHMVFDGNPVAMPPSLPGDYNNNHVVDGADYVVWRENAGTTNALPNDPIGGTIGSAHYNQWRAHFGMTPSGGGSAAVPEPQVVALLAIAVTWALCRRATH